MTTSETKKPVHQGRNVKRFREMAGLKQEALADMLGEDWSQKKVSTVEGKEVIEDRLLDELATALKVPAEAIKTLSDDTMYQIINNNYTDFKDNAVANGTANGSHFNCTFNPLDEVKRLNDEVKRLNDEREELYKALLKEKDEKLAFMAKLLEQK